MRDFQALWARWLGVAALTLGGVSAARGQAVAVPPLEIDGLVVDETQSRIGHEFFDLFHARWRAPRGAQGFTLVVQEQPLPNLGTRVTVRVNDDVVYQAHLQPRYEVLEESALQAAYYAFQAVLQRVPPEPARSGG